jgi:hypothetical protein
VKNSEAIGAKGPTVETGAEIHSEKNSQSKNSFGEVAGYKINSNKSMAFLSTVDFHVVSIPTLLY